MDILAKTSISEVILLFVLLFLLPLLALLVFRLRRYEKLLQEGGGVPDDIAKTLPEPKASPPPAPEPKEEEAPAGVYPYAVKVFLTPADKACLESMHEALGPDVAVYPKVALWEMVESTDKAPAFAKKLHGLDFDFLVCDRQTGKPLTAVMYMPGKGRPSGKVDEVRKVCNAAGANMVFIEMMEKYDVASLKDALGIPDLDM